MQEVLVRIEGRAIWKYFQDDGSWVAICDDLKLTAVGDTESEMVESIVDMLGHLLHDALKSGALVGILSRHGWHADLSEATKHPDRARFDLPIDVLRASAPPQYAMQ